MQTPQALTTLQRGDWEAPDTMLVVFEDGWKESVIDMVESARQDVDVTVLVRSRQHASQTRALWPPGSKNIKTVMVQLDTPWIRDFGPLQVRDGEGRLSWLDSKYSDDRALDDKLPTGLAALFDMQLHEVPFTLDGGGLASNGRGLCIMTTETLSQIEFDMEDPASQEMVLGQLGCQALVVTPAIPEEPTGHIDMVVQFVSPDRALVGFAGDEYGLASPEVAEAIDTAYDALVAGAEMLGQPLHVVRVPFVVKEDVFYSYVNGLGLNHQYLAPAFRGVPESVQSAAHEQIRQAVGPERRTQLIDAEAMAVSGGAVHCVTLGLDLR